MITTKEQINRAARTYIERDMIPSAKNGLQRIAYRGLGAVIEECPDFLMRFLMDRIPIIQYTDIICENDNVDIDKLAIIAEKAFGNDELPVKAAGVSLMFNADDIRAIKSYIE